MTRATATVLFTDLVGSTELRSRLGEEPAEELRRRHDRLPAEAIEANGGYLVKHLGDGVMATFGGFLGETATCCAHLVSTAVNATWPQQVALSTTVV